MADLPFLLQTRDDARDCGLVRMFAELVGQQKLWEDAMNEIGFIESPMIGRMLSEAEARGEILGKRGILLRLLAKRCWAVPAEVTQAIHGCTDAAKLDAWFSTAPSMLRTWSSSVRMRGCERLACLSWGLVS